MENKNALNDKELRKVNGGMIPFLEDVSSGTSQKGVIKCPQCQNPIPDFMLELLMFHALPCPYCCLVLNIDPEKIKKVLEEKKNG